MVLAIVNKGKTYLVLHHTHEEIDAAITALVSAREEPHLSGSYYKFHLPAILCLIKIASCLILHLLSYTLT